MKINSILFDDNDGENNQTLTKREYEKKTLSLDIDKFKQQFKATERLPLEKDNGIMTKELCEKTIEVLKAIKKWDSNEITFAMIVGVVQQGGSNKLNNNKNITFEMDKIKLTSTELHEAINKATINLKKKKNYTVRQFCRTMGDEIAEFAAIMELEGDLTQKMRLDVSDLSPEDAIWCSNFQTRNPNCPKKVKDWLVSNFKQHFRT